MSFVSDVDYMYGTDPWKSKLTRLEFPRTEIQAYGNTAIIYTSYRLDLTEAGKPRTERGKATEIFVRQGDRWLNTGWQLAPESPQ